MIKNGCCVYLNHLRIILNIGFFQEISLQTVAHGEHGETQSSTIYIFYNLKKGIMNIEQGILNIEV